MSPREIGTVLVIDDCPGDFVLLQHASAGKICGLTLVHEVTLKGGIARLKTEDFAGVLLDLNLPGEAGGVGTLQTLRAAVADLPTVVIFSGTADPREISACLREGAAWFLPKDDITTHRVECTLCWALGRTAVERAVLCGLAEAQEYLRVIQGASGGAENLQRLRDTLDGLTQQLQAAIAPPE